VGDAVSVTLMEPIVRGLTAAAKALRLYPPTSPIPHQAAESATGALATFLAAEPVLPLRVVRDGLAWGGATVAPGAPGATELADALRDHDVAEVDFLPGVDVDELLAFLGAVLMRPEDAQGRGGLAAVLAAAGVENVRIASVSLTVVDPFALPGADEDADDFLRELAADPQRVSAWLSVASKGDPAALSASIADLARASGGGDPSSLIASLSAAFGTQDLDVREALMGVALDDGPARALLASVFSKVGTAEIAGTLVTGTYGRNMLSMSSAISRLPLAERIGDVLAQVKELLPQAGHSEKELTFLDHMLAVRSTGAPESALAEAQPVYRQVAELTRVDAAQVSGARDDITRAGFRADDSAVATLLTLLDQQQDLDLYCRSLSALAGMVPPLMERGRLDLCARVVTELASREARAVQPWPELTAKLKAAIAEAASRRTMKALVDALIADPGGLPAAGEIMQRAGDAAAMAFVEEALAHKPDRLDVAEKVLGRRLIDMLAAAAAHAQWFQVAPLAARLAVEGDPRAGQAIEGIVNRADDASRREAATGLAQAGGPGALVHLAKLARDSSPEVAIAAVRGIGRASAPGCATALEIRLSELDVDGKDFPLAREIIGALARTSDTSAVEALGRLSSRRAFIKRGHFAEVQELARQALAARLGGGAS
jgi:hypothetical protein